MTLEKTSSIVYLQMNLEWILDPSMCEACLNKHVADLWHELTPKETKIMIFVQKI